MPTLRDNACEILDGLKDHSLVGFGAFSQNKVVGYATIGTHFLGSNGQYLQLVDFQVSESYRGQKIGRQLFQMICRAARTLHAQKLYISAHSSKESQAAYRSLGCIPASEIIAKLAELEPFDVQMELVL